MAYGNQALKSHKRQFFRAVHPIIGSGYIKVDEIANAIKIYNQLILSIEEL